jgi:hypothetical protein
MVASIASSKALLAACFMLVSGVPYFSTMKMEAVCVSETSINF